MKSDYTDQENIILQSCMTVFLLLDLRNNDFVKSEFFDSMTFREPWFKDQIRSVNIDNQGCLMMILYALLVLPYEILQKEYADEFEKIETILDSILLNISTDYKKDCQKVNHVWHIRNSIAHGKISFRVGNVVIFEDVALNNDKNGNERIVARYYSELPLSEIGGLIQKLVYILQKYVAQIHNRQIGALETM